MNIEIDDEDVKTLYAMSDVFLKTYGLNGYVPISKLLSKIPATPKEEKHE